MHKLSYYVRRKLRHRFTQGTFLESNEFIKFLDKHGIRIDKEELERFEKEGWLQPSLRIVLTGELQKQTLSTGIRGLKKFYKDGMIEFPRGKNYEPWKNFASDHKKGERHDRKLMHYHQFQIIQILHIMQTKRCSFTCYDSDNEQDMQNKLEFMRKIMMRRDEKAFKRDAELLANRVGVLMMLEEPYRAHSFGKLSSNGFNADSWHEWTQKTFSPQKLIHDLGLSTADVRRLHDQIASCGYRMDPLDHWFDLTRIMRPSVLEKLKGKARTAQLYYGIARMLSALYCDLTKEILPEPDTIFDGRQGRWKKNTYSNPFDYATRKTQRGIIRFFVRDPTTRIFLLIEGDTEEKIIGEIFDRLDISMQDDGINVMNCNGIGNMDEKKLDKIIKTANQDDVYMYVLVDNEENSVQKVEKIKTKINTNFNSHIWKKSFEEDNFGRCKVINWFNSYLSKYDKNLTYQEIATQQNNGAALVKAIEKSYGVKYQGDIYCAIRKKKTDVSLELIEPRLGKISSGMGMNNPSKIETVLDEVFRMIPSRG